VSVGWRHSGKRGYDFVDIQAVFDGRPRRDFESPRGGEALHVSIAELCGKLVAVTWTLRGDAIVRLISPRRAGREEERQYRQIHG
jgi:uncharacterized DUF497 family protein